MSMLSKLKNNSFLRGLCFSMRSIGNHFVVCKKKFAQYSDNVVVTPPLCIGNYKNVYLGEKVCIGANAYISALNARFICKGNCAILQNPPNQKAWMKMSLWKRMFGLDVMSHSSLELPLAEDRPWLLVL